MKTLKKITLAILVISAIASLVACNSDLGLSEIKEGGDKYIDCSEYEYLKGESNDLITGCEVTPHIKFDSFEDFCTFLKEQEFTDEQKEQLAKMAVDGKVQMPETNNLRRLQYGEQLSNEIIWASGNRYNSSLKGEFNGMTFKATYLPVYRPERVEAFIADREDMAPTAYERNDYTENGISYTVYKGYDTSERPYEHVYWNFSCDGKTYYVEKFMSKGGELGLSDYASNQILLKDDNGYHWIDIMIEDPSVIDCDFVKQFNTVSISID